MDDNSKYTGAYADLLTQIAENVEAVYAAGVKSEYDRFWDEFQTNGTRTAYMYGFAGEGWNNKTFNPKYRRISVSTCSYMFYDCGLTDYDFVEKGVEIDVSGATSVTYMFGNANGIKRVGVFDCRGCKDINRPFYYSGIITVDKFIVKETTKYDNTFAAAINLENITIEGIIGQNGFNVSACVGLTHESLMSIKRALKSGVSGLTVTFSTKHKEDGKLTDSDIAEISAKGWSVAFK